MKKLSTTIVLLVMITLFAQAQAVTAPAPSPAGSVYTSVGLTDIKVEYSRPRAKGRKIFGADDKALVPYGKIWRTGANRGTVISFSNDVTVECINVPAGQYLIFSWPGATEWTITLYKDLSIGGYTDKYKKEDEVANFKVKSSKLAEKVDTFTISIGDISDDSKTAKVQIAWENTSVKFTVKSDFEAKK